MKLSNNAIKFLMSHYRAIYKNAWVKGLATAALLTAGLTAGQAANADALTDLSKPAGNVVITGTGGDKGPENWESLTVSGDNALPAPKGDITITGGKPAANYIKPGTGNNATLTSTHDLNIASASDNTVGISIGAANSKSISATFKNVNVFKGAVELNAKGSGESGSLLADTITVGSGAELAAGDASITVGAKSALGKDLKEGALSGLTSITVNKGGVLQTAKLESSDQNDVENITVKAGTFNINGGAFTLNSKDDGSKGAKAALNLVKGQMSDGSITVNKGSELTVSFFDAGKSVKDEAGKEVARSFDMTSGSVTVKGALKVSGQGVVSMADEVAFTGADDATFTVSGADTGKNLTLKVSGNQLTEIVGALKLDTKNAVLSITGSDTLDLGTLTFAKSAATKGSIYAQAGTSVEAENVAVTSKVENADSVAVTATGKLTLGKAGADLANGVGFAGFTAKNVEFVGKDENTAFTLKKGLTLKSTKEVAQADGTSKTVADSGTIIGDVNVDEAMTIDAGIYSTSSSFAVNAKELKVTSNGDVASELIISGGKITLSDADASKLTASGSKAVIDLTNATVEKTDGKTGAPVVTANGGTIKITADGLKGLIIPKTSGNKGAKVDIKSGGSVLVDGAVELSKDQIAAAAGANGGIAVGDGGKLVTSELLITGADAGVAVNANGNVQADVLTFKSANADTSKLGAGNFVAVNSLSSTKGDGAVSAILVSGGKLTLGSADGAADATGELGSSLKIGDATSKGNLIVAGGNWAASSQDVTLDSGSIVIGGQLASTAKQDDPFTGASLSVKTLTTNKDTLTVSKGAKLTADTLVNSGAAITVANGASASFKTLDMSAGTGTLKVSGSVSVQGKAAQAQTAAAPSQPQPQPQQPATADSVKLHAGSITVSNKGDLSFGKDAVAAIKVGAAGTALTVDSGSFVDGSITVDKGGVVNMAFGKDDVFTAEKLVALRKVFGKSGTELVDGVINLGEAQIAGVSDKITNVSGTSSIKWDDISGVSDVFADTTNEQLKNVVVTNVDDSSAIRGNFGSIKANAGTNKVCMAGNATFSNAMANGGNFVSDGTKALGVEVQFGQLGLNGAGNIGKVDLKGETSLQIAAGEAGTVNVAGDVKGASGTMIVTTGKAAVSGKLETKTLTTESGTAVSAGELKLGAGESVIGGDLSVTKNATLAGKTSVAGALKVDGTLQASGDFAAAGDVTVSGASTFGSKAELAGNNTMGEVTFNGSTDLTKGKTTAAAVTLGSASGDALEITQGATLTAAALTGKSGAQITVGTAGTPAADGVAAVPSTAGYLFAKTAQLKGASIVADPDFGTASTLVAIDTFAPKIDETVAGTAGKVDGNLYALRNSVIALGTDSAEVIKNDLQKYFDADGSLDKDGMGAVAYVVKSVTIGSGNKVVVDKTATDKTLSAKQAGYGTADLYLGDGSVLAVKDQALLKAGTAAVTFENANASVSVTDTSRVVIAGNAFAAHKGMKLFGSADAAAGKVNLNKDLLVESVNGLYNGVLKAGEVQGQELVLNFDARAAQAQFGAVSGPVYQTLITYGQRAHNPAATEEAEKGVLVGDLAVGFALQSGKVVKVDGETTVEATDKDLEDAGLKVNGLTNYTVVGENLYYTADNGILNYATGNIGAAIDAEVTARLGDFGGMAQTAIKAGASSYEAIAARMGVGAGAAVTAAATEGNTLWVTPVYKQADSDGFDADNKTYGADISLYGVALGADFTVMPGVTVGGMFNVGSGDADGQGLGSGVSNDFDYYGFGGYAAYQAGPLAVIGDVTWTSVDNDVTGNTGLGQLSASMKSAALSVGVTGQYQMVLGGTNVTPHAGLRFTNIDIDDYSVASADGVQADYAADKLNMFSVPVGVTLDKTYTFDAWTVKPAFDLTLTGNFGDTENKGTVSWAGVNNLTTELNSQVIDNFTYGATFGVSATNGSLGMGVGVGYTGSSNTDDFGVNANVRYTF
ncbi:MULTISPECIES: autotransporter outer membrane beta-barrel domain-containing protein [unclassified Anaerobiospirillum]|uniref:autotransporter domain-containing protein n=1 Tax=unclassified Anaerobiospirillum TaxID=2647410 RepID=UPI001FF6653A|nr:MULTISPECIES: autotransporter outer membrane beta-barrel domain-containing protein [unclassified Anaerobiospirillum]MCK0535371.1 autotransporter outer membrane beta-barrel domain-containing protein [Anaerobiospirillum sp. NML120511]MCK0540339.1 autotransporter outer membrane beta-barrel domain-containing protein [Anaerobiospirillum sp. NML02-A-032]